MCFKLLKSSVGKKYVMAVTGIFLSLFVIAHLLGNLQIFLGPEALNEYADVKQTPKETTNAGQGEFHLKRVRIVLLTTTTAREAPPRVNREVGVMKS